MTESSNSGRRQVIVIGSGIAGTAAALAAASSNAHVALIDGGPGASSLWTGAIDFLDWQTNSTLEPLAERERRALSALTGYSVLDRSCSILTTAGVVRPARGRDAALLDVSNRGPAQIAVVRCPRPGWHADSLVRAWGEGFGILDAPVVRYTDESTLPDVDLAARHDDPQRLAWLAERLREALRHAPTRWSALVLPPLLGVDRNRADDLSRLVGLPCGEALSSPGGAPGARFESARDRALATAGVAVVRARVSSVKHANTRFSLTVSDGQELAGDAVVLATGGLMGGGIEYAPSEVSLATALPSAARAPFRLSFEARAILGTGGRRLDPPGSLFGFAPETLARPFTRAALLDRAGILVDEADEVQGDDGTVTGLFAAGDAVADAPRTWLGALAAGGRAGAAAGARLP